MVSRSGAARQAVSAGGVIARRSRGCTEVVLGGRAKDSFWALPKGTPELGETLERTAAREVQEETGLLVVIQQGLGTIRYQFTEDGVRYDKRVEYYLMAAVGGDLELHDHEFDDVGWFCAEEALRLLTYPNERAVLAGALCLFEQEDA